ncbi:Gfo/Idh/MocA family oxidoreductase [Arachidicoccus ginsenosidivorans]|uniref:Gfo/Idh/MocA family oxidoreductase n=1 Tax=Arachidicoccus ginsenosidivorans TaxID=496057 RepID=A0A5B8VPX0_9BACT|nr:Gfo/Idh/MocA family oxidoreductase [Arachidicoccus ginsenosidivorans]QEC73151.1 Gfo/Idh/MocA family oxidoreductase [Arachidicoccus ginsenosidivorans]
MSEKTTKVVLIGYGHIGKRHAAVIMGSKYFELVALVDTHHEKRPENLPESVSFFATLNDFLAAEKKAGLAIIATPNGLHGQQIKQCLDNGLNVVAEKPIVLSSTELTALHHKAINAGLQLFPVVQNRYAKIATWLQQLLQKELLGQIYIIQVNCLWNRDERYYQKESWHGDLQLDGGSLYTQFLHFIDMLYWLFGKPSVKSATLLDFNHQALSNFEDSGLIQFGFTKGIAKDALTTMTFSTAAWSQNAESSLTIIAEKGSIKIAGQYMEKLQYAIGDGLPNEVALQEELSMDIYKEKYGAAGGHYQFWDEMEKFYKGQSHALPTVQEATEVIEIIEQIYQNR